VIKQKIKSNSVARELTTPPHFMPWIENIRSVTSTSPTCLSRGVCIGQGYLCIDL